MAYRKPPYQRRGVREVGSMGKWNYKTIRTLNGEWARKKRIKAGVSLRELARRCEVSPTFISDVELGRRNASEYLVLVYENLKK